MWRDTKGIPIEDAAFIIENCISDILNAFITKEPAMQIQAYESYAYAKALLSHIVIVERERKKEQSTPMFGSLSQRVTREMEKEKPSTDLDIDHEKMWEKVGELFDEYKTKDDRIEDVKEALGNISRKTLEKMKEESVHCEEPICMEVGADEIKNY